MQLVAGALRFALMVGVPYGVLMGVLAWQGSRPEGVGLLVVEALVLAGFSAAFTGSRWTVLAGVIGAATVAASGFALSALLAQFPLLGYSCLLMTVSSLTGEGRRPLGATLGALLGFLLFSLPFWCGVLSEKRGSEIAQVSVFLCPLGAIGSATGRDPVRMEHLYRFSELVSFYRFSFPSWWLVGIVYWGVGMVLWVTGRVKGASVGGD